MENLNTNYECPECGEELLYDVHQAPNRPCGVILVSFYCSNDECDFYSAGYLDIVEEVLIQGGDTGW